MNVLSLFDGMSCGQIALQKLGIKYDNYFASEIDSHAIKVAKANFPNTKHIGSVVNVKASDLPKIDLLIGGSPCQGFSFAGKQLNFNDPRSKLFFEFVRLLQETKPKYFLLENVKMKKEYQNVISEHLGVEPIEINSNLVSAQNRKRLYWTNIPNIQKPKDKEIFFKDILEVNFDEKYLLSDKMLKWLDPRNKKIVDINGKSSCFTAGGNSGGLHSQMDLISTGCIKFGRTEETKLIRKENMRNGKDYTPFQSKEIIDIDFEKMNTITTVGSKDNLLIIAERGRKNEYGKYIQQFEQNFTGKSNSLTTVQKDNLLLKKSPCLHGFEHGTNGQFNRQLGIGGMIRRLTPIECERLQTVPDNYTNVVSDTQRYKMLGNGWTVDVISHILSFASLN